MKLLFRGSVRRRLSWGCWRLLALARTELCRQIMVLGSLRAGGIAREIIERAIATDEAEDQEHGEKRGDELPDELATEEGRRAWLARELAAERDTGATPEPEPDSGHEFDA